MSFSQSYRHQAISLILQNDDCRKRNRLSDTFSAQHQFPPRLQLCGRRVNVRASGRAASANVCVYVRGGVRQHCKFSLAIILRRVMLRSASAASQKVLTRSVLWMRRHVCEEHRLRVRILYGDVIQSHRATEELETQMQCERHQNIVSGVSAKTSKYYNNFSKAKQMLKTLKSSKNTRSTLKQLFFQLLLTKHF